MRKKKSVGGKEGGREGCRDRQSFFNSQFLILPFFCVIFPPKLTVSYFLSFSIHVFFYAVFSGSFFSNFTYSTVVPFLPLSLSKYLLTLWPLLCIRYLLLPYFYVKLCAGKCSSYYSRLFPSLPSPLSPLPSLIPLFLILSLSPPQ